MDFLGSGHFASSANVASYFQNEHKCKLERRHGKCPRGQTSTEGLARWTEAVDQSESRAIKDLILIHARTGCGQTKYDPYNSGGSQSTAKSKRLENCLSGDMARKPAISQGMGEKRKKKPS